MPTIFTKAYGVVSLFTKVAYWATIAMTIPAPLAIKVRVFGVLFVHDFFKGLL